MGIRNFIVVILLVSLLLCACNNNGRKEKVNQKDDNAFDLAKIKLPPGYTISLYAKVKNARSMALSPGGVLYVGNRSGKSVYAVVDENKDGVGDKVYTVADGLNTPNGVAFKDGSLFIATINSILRLDNVENKLATPPKPVVVYDKFPGDEHHGWKFIAFGPDGKLYVPVGAPCNICEKKDPIYATITRMNVDGTPPEIFASGIRNSVGFTWHPVTNQLWFTENGGDMMGNDVPADELNVAPAPGLHFGFPYCHQGNILDDEFGVGKDCSAYTPPVQLLGPHVAALGMRFYTGNMFETKYKNQIFIAEHGSWNRDQPIGYRITTVALDSSGKSSGYSTFAEGWLQAGSVLGRPVDVLVMPDGALLVSDDYNDAVYRITYKKF
ncbi:MAG: sorbosone dehydrogenase family protein [Ferruginibacter sp.]